MLKGKCAIVTGAAKGIGKAIALKLASLGANIVLNYRSSEEKAIETENEIKEKKLPALDDEFAKDVSEFDTLKDLKTSIREKKQAENDDKAKHETEHLAIDAVSANTEIDIPSGMIEKRSRTTIIIPRN